MKKRVALFGESRDEAEVCATLREDGLEVSGYERAWSSARLQRADVVVVDQKQDAPSSLSWRHVEGVCRQKPVVLFSDVEEQRCEARRWGAYYVGHAATRSPAEVSLVARRAVSVAEPRRPLEKAEVLVGDSPGILALRRAVQRLASSPATSVLVEAEPGSGRRTLARALHVETAHGGGFHEPRDPKELAELVMGDRPVTIYVPELTELSATFEARLCRILEARRTSSHVRVIGGLSTRAGRKTSELEQFLLHRFGVRLEVPPLRSRLEDLPLLVSHLLVRLARAHSLPPAKASAGALRALERHEWPGNVRELHNVLQRALLLASGGWIEESHLQLPERRSPTGYRLPVEGVDWEALEREVLSQALTLARGNRTRAASLLGLTRDQVRYRLAKLASTDPKSNVA